MSRTLYCLIPLVLSTCLSCNNNEPKEKAAKFEKALTENDYRYLAKRILAGRIPTDDRRYESFIRTMQLLNQRKVKVIIETGTTRGGESDVGAGAATILFGDWAYQNGARLYSVDINPYAIAVASGTDGVKAYKNYISIVYGDSVEYLQDFPEPIDFLYLDSLDYDTNNPAESQEHHLKEIIAAYPKLHKNSLVLIDDCDLPGGGKGKLVIEYLRDKGWKTLYSGYQVLMSQ